MIYKYKSNIELYLIIMKYKRINELFLIKIKYKYKSNN